MYPMQHAEREIRDKDILCAILDKSDVMTMSFVDGDRPYAVPVNFGYSFEDDKVFFYFHCARKGAKLDIAARNPNVCVTVWRYRAFKSEQDPEFERHTYCSVMAFGKLEKLELDTDRAEYAKAMRCLLKCTGLMGKLSVTPKKLSDMYMCRIVCEKENVVGKAEHVITSPEDVEKRFGDIDY